MRRIFSREAKQLMLFGFRCSDRQLRVQLGARRRPKCLRAMQSKGQAEGDSDLLDFGR